MYTFTYIFVYMRMMCTCIFVLYCIISGSTAASAAATRREVMSQLLSNTSSSAAGGQQDDVPDDNFFDQLMRCQVIIPMLDGSLMWLNPDEHKCSTQCKPIILLFFFWESFYVFPEFSMKWLPETRNITRKLTALN